MTFHRRKDRGCEARVMAVVGNRILVEAKWPKNNRNIVFLDREYFENKYGVTC